MIRCTWCSLVGLTLLLLAPGFAAAEEGKPTDVVGEWEMTVNTPQGVFTVTMKMQRMGDQLVGVTLGHDGKETKLNDIKLAGKTLTFNQDLSGNGVEHHLVEHHLVYSGTVDGDSIKGAFEMNGVTLSASARRVRPTAAAPASTLAGTWKLAVEGHDQTHHLTLLLTERDGKWSGKLVDQQGHGATLKELMVRGAQIGFVADFDRGGMVIHLKFNGTRDGDRLKGSMEANGHTVSTTGERAPKA